MYKRYKHLVIEKSDEPPTQDEIQTIEFRLGAKLPSDIVDFLQVGNGGSLDDYFVIVPLSPEPERMTFGGIFTTKDNGPESFLSELELHRNPKYPLIPEQVLPVARDGGGSTLYLDLRNAGESPVVAFIHGLPAWTGLRQQDELIRLANSFSQYLDLLQFDAEYNKQLLQEAIAEKDLKRVAAIVEYLDLAFPNWREIFGIDPLPGIL